LSALFIKNKDIMTGGLWLSFILTGPIGITTSYFILRYFFKDSILFKIIFAPAIAMLITSFLSYAHGRLGDENVIWTFPCIIIVNVLACIYVFRLIKKPLVTITSNIEKLSQGNLRLNIDQELLNRNDELGILAKATLETSKKLNKVIGTVINGAENITSASQLFNSSAMQISQGANLQATTVEEVSDPS
jgi:Methyl-accepting chemotaxis protein